LRPREYKLDSSQPVQTTFECLSLFASEEILVIILTKTLLELAGTYSVSICKLGIFSAGADLRLWTESVLIGI